MLVLVLWLRCVCPSAAETAPSAMPDRSGVEHFERHIRPLLEQHCAECHSASAKPLGGGLRVDGRSGLLRGGDSGAALVPGDPDASLLIQAIRYEDGSLQMPPTGKLSAEAIAHFETWVAQGAPDPRDLELNDSSPTGGGASPTPWEELFRQRADWWSLRPLADVAIPPAIPPATASSLTATASTAVDRFIQAKLSAEGLSPAPSATPHVFLRRAALVLTGLAPTTDMVHRFEQQCAARSAVEGPLPPSVVERWVDHLLASPHFGERWARHWQDVVRFSETHGNEWNYEVHHAWRYRDYLIRAFNADVPYDQLVREHLAGDLLERPRWNDAEQINESLIATAFLRFGEVNHDDCIDLRELGFDVADNQIDTLTKAFQATTVACARCHDHKLDAISMRDYYGLLGVLRSSRLVAHTLDAPHVNSDQLDQMIELREKLRTEIASAWRSEVALLPRYWRSLEEHVSSSSNAAVVGTELDASRWQKWLELRKSETVPREDPLAPWHQWLRLVSSSKPADSAVRPTAAIEAIGSAEWQRVRREYAEAQRQIGEFNAQFIDFADFRQPGNAPWQATGRAAATAMGPSGDLVIDLEGTSVVKTVLPAGFFSHRLSDKLNATLRSPHFPAQGKYVSFHVMGQRSSAVRLVSNNCQLNYRNYRALTQADLQWITFPIPEDRDTLHTYAELMTMFDNPKFPDQLSALGGDGANYRLPWEEIAANPRSLFGITRVVLHETEQAPRAELQHIDPLFEGNDVANIGQLADRYVCVLQGALTRWEQGCATDHDVLWINALLRRGLLPNDVDCTTNSRSWHTSYVTVERQITPPRVAPGVGESGYGVDHPLFIRGDCRRPGDTTPRGFLEVLSRQSASLPIPAEQSGRRQLAEIIASPDNPLTARVMVNRIWHHLYGAGIVRTVDDFGHVGELPSHPELLDYLSREFISHGWSIKHMIRTMVLSHTFQAAAVPSSLALQRDPTNRWLQHYPARRMEGEAIRDGILMAAGQLRETLYGASVQPYREGTNADRRLFPGPLDGNGRRSVYIKNNLMETPRFLGAFNFPGGKVAQGRRDVTNVPAQALTLLNDPLVRAQAAAWAEQCVRQSDPSVAARLHAMLERAVQRSPSAQETALWEGLVDELSQLHGVTPDQVMISSLVWQDVAHAMFNMKEFIYIP